MALLDPGDDVLLPAPYWVSYPEMIRLADGVPIELPTTEATGFRVTIDQLEAALTPKTKALLFVSPSNPTGAVYSHDEILALATQNSEFALDVYRKLAARWLEEQA